MKTKQALGCLFGMAFGDALGFKTEFLSVDEIVTRFPPNGPQEIVGSPALVTDDTQMALAVGEALLQAPKPFAPETLEALLREAFVDWAGSPDNNRAPGMTCMTACGRLHTGMLWTEATVQNSKGCGANMRVQAVGVLPDVSPKTGGSGAVSGCADPRTPDRAGGVGFDRRRHCISDCRHDAARSAACFARVCTVSAGRISRRLAGDAVAAAYG